MDRGQVSSTELRSSYGGKIGSIAVPTRSWARSDSNWLAKCGLPVNTLISPGNNPFQWAGGKFPPLNCTTVMVGRLDQLQPSQARGLDQTVTGWLSVVSL